MKNEYRREMEALGPRPEELERLYQMMEGEAEMKKAKRFGDKAVAVLVCAALMVTAATAAAAPAVWEALQARLGAFAPYAHAIEGAACTDQGIELQVLSAISDELEAQVYLAARDVEGDRLNEFLKLNGRLTAGEAKEPERDTSSMIAVVGGFSTDYFKLVSYDPGTKTALFSAGLHYMDSSRPNGRAKLEVAGMSTREAELAPKAVPCASVTGAALDSLPAGEDDRVIFSPSMVEGIGYTDDVLPEQQVVLAPGQTPMAIEGTEDIRVSSMGFAGDGCFHIRLEFADGVEPATCERVNFDTETGAGPAKGEVTSLLYCDLLGEGGDMKYYVSQERLVEGGMDVLFPLVTAEDLEELRGHEARVYGTYTRPGTDIEGSWSTEFDLDYYESTVLDWTGELAGWQVERVTVSPLSVTMSSNASGWPNDPLYAVKKDGSTVAAQPGTSSYVNVGALAGEPEDRWEAYTTWRFEEPVEVEDIASLRLGDETIPMK